MLTSRIGLNGLIGFVRRTSTFSLSAGIQKSHFFTTSQSLNFKPKEKFLFPQKCNLFESNLMKQELSYRTFSTKLTPAEAEFQKGYANGPWTLVVGCPHLYFFHILIAKIKVYYKITCALILSWVTYNYYFTGYFGSTVFAATYCTFLIVVPLSFVLYVKRHCHKITCILLLENGEILIGYISTFFKHKIMIVPMNDILFEKKTTIKNGIQYLILSKKSNKKENFFICQSDLTIYDKKKAKRIFNNFDVFTEDVYKNKKK